MNECWMNLRKNGSIFLLYKNGWKTSLNEWTNKPLTRAKMNKQVRNDRMNEGINERIKFGWCLEGINEWENVMNLVAESEGTNENQWRHVNCSSMFDIHREEWTKERACREEEERFQVGVGWMGDSALRVNMVWNNRMNVLNFFFNIVKGYFFYDRSNTKNGRRDEWVQCKSVKSKLTKDLREVHKWMDELRKGLVPGHKSGNSEWISNKIISFLQGMRPEGHDPEVWSATSGETTNSDSGHGGSDLDIQCVKVSRIRKLPFDFFSSVFCVF